MGTTPTVWAFDLGKGSIGEAVRQGGQFLHKAMLLLPAAFGKNKTGEDEPRRFCLRNAFERGVFAWRTASLLIQETVCVANFVLIPI